MASPLQRTYSLVNRLLEVTRSAELAALNGNWPQYGVMLNELHGLTKQGCCYIRDMDENVYLAIPDEMRDTKYRGCRTTAELAKVDGINNAPAQEVPTTVAAPAVKQK